ncbi:protein FAM83F isoform X1 [Brachyistius frenatus]|uniref:protein FAM83F isoform X1 n=1 Tax=Brachyistius frenatus TaxID=100188 RepID=UPI0037E782F0
MSNSQEQSLDENVVFLPVDESCAEFLHCEREREAVERLLSAGPEAFNSSVGTKRSACFLSAEEVGQITSWAQNYRHNRPQVEQENGAGSSSEMEDFPDTYFPCHSDMPTPDLDLGWPERDTKRVQTGNVTVHTSPPAEGDPSVREIIRRHLQKASQVIAIVTDRLTDGAIISDLHYAASRGVPVYIILNQRSIQENFTLNRLRHPNMRVRVLGGKTFCSRAGRIVVGEMKDKFLLVDLETVIHGSYSLTWTDARLHRQLITVLSGPVIDSFDREFRILFAASLPVPDTWKVTGTHANVPHCQLKELSDIRFQKQLSLEPEITHPPSPPADFLLDWEAMGVVQRNRSPVEQHEEIMVKEMPQQPNMLFEENKPIMEGPTNNGNQLLERRLHETAFPATTGVSDRSTTFNNKEPVSADPATTEIMKRLEFTIEKAISRQLSKENNSNLHDRNTTTCDDKATEPTHKLSSTETRERSVRKSVLEEESRTDENSSRVENTPFSRRPVILRVPQSENYSSLSDIMKRIQRSSPGLHGRRSNAASEQTRPAMELSVHNTDTNHDESRAPVPRFKVDPYYVTPALALMKRRNEEVKSALYRTPRTFLARERPRSTSHAAGMDWRRSITEREGEQE